MKKVMLALTLIMIGVMVWGEGHDNSQFEKYQQYREDPGAENFREAYNFYCEQESENSKILQMYLHWQELNRLIDNYETEIDSLEQGTRFQLANLLLEIGRNKDAITIYDVLTEISPQWACPWRHKGEAYWNLKNYNEAENALKKSIEVRENHYDAYVMLAEVYHEQGKYEEALEVLSKGLEYRAENPEYSEDEEFEDSVKELHRELLIKTGKL